jgi:hypothetical protein
MGVENLKVWHWMLISLFVGVAIALAQASMEPADVEHTIKQNHFEINLLRQPDAASGNQPWVRNIVVYPPRRAYNGVPVQRVEFQWLTRTDKPGVLEYQRCVFNADQPYQPLFPATPYTAQPRDTALSIVQKNIGVANESAVMALMMVNPHTLSKENGHVTPGREYFIPGPPVDSVRDYLARMSKQYNWVKYRYAWWDEPRSIFTIWMGGCFVVIGVLWPTSLRLLGVGPAAAARDDYDLSRFGKSAPAKKPAMAATASARLSPEEEKRLAEMEARVIASLAVERGDLPAPAPAKAPEPVKVLNAGPLEPPAPVAEGETEAEKDYKGEYYPVALEAKKDEEKAE